MKLREIVRWSPENPRRYRAVVELRDGRRISERHAITFGFRTIEARDRSIRLNGRPLLLRGVLDWGHEPSHIAPAPTEEEVRTRATHTSFVNCGYHYGGKTPPRPSSWLFLTGAVTGGMEEARALSGSWLSPARVESSHLFEGYSYSQRAYCFRAREPGPVSIRLLPSRPIINPTLRLYFGRPPVKVVCDGKELPESDFRAQAVGDDVVVWINRVLEAETSLEITPA